MPKPALKGTAIAPEVLDRACLLHLQGRTVRSLARQFNARKSTLHYHLLKRLGKGANRSHSGSVPIISEFLETARITPRQRSDIRRWVATNLERIIQVDAQYTTPLLTARREQALTNSECGSVCDFRSNLRDGGGYAA